VIANYQKNLLKNISTWIEILEEMSKNTTDTSGLPKLEVSLRSGRMYSGSVIGLKKSTDENFVLLWEQPDLHIKARVHLIQCEDITALSFVDPDTFVSIFSKPVVSELELKRKTKAIEDQIEEIVSKRISVSLSSSITESDRSHVLQMIEVIPEIFKKLTEDNISKNAVSEQISEIEIQVDKTAGTILNKNQLICIFAKDSEVFLSRQKDALFNSIEKVL
jgi:hypothetical protein